MTYDNEFMIFFKLDIQKINCTHPFLYHLMSLRGLLLFFSIIQIKGK